MGKIILPDPIAVPSKSHRSAAIKIFFVVFIVVSCLCLAIFNCSFPKAHFIERMVVSSGFAILSAVYASVNNYILWKPITITHYNIRREIYISCVDNEFMEENKLVFEQWSRVNDQKDVDALRNGDEITITFVRDIGLFTGWLHGGYSPVVTLRFQGRQVEVEGPWYLVRRISYENTNEDSGDYETSKSFFFELIRHFKHFPLSAWTGRSRDERLTYPIISQYLTSYPLRNIELGTTPMEFVHHVFSQGRIPYLFPEWAVSINVVDGSFFPIPEGFVENNFLSELVDEFYLRIVGTAAADVYALYFHPTQLNSLSFVKDAFYAKGLYLIESIELTVVGNQIQWRLLEWGILINATGIDEWTDRRGYHHDPHNFRLFRLDSYSDNSDNKEAGNKIFREFVLNPLFDAYKHLTERRIHEKPRGAQLVTRERRWEEETE